LEDTNPEVIWELYENTAGRQVNIVDLARSIAASAGEISLARHPGDIFESDAAYKRIFSEKRLASITFLTFLQNLHDLLPLVLKKDLNLEQQGNGPRPGSLGYYVMCLLVRYLAKQKKYDVVRDFGGRLWGRQEQFRSSVKSLLDNYHSRIKGVLKEKFLVLEDSRADSLRGVFMRAEASLRLRNDIDVFETFKDLDDL
jgi:hypothetical protein